MAAVYRWSAQKKHAIADMDVSSIGHMDMDNDVRVHSHDDNVYGRFCTVSVSSIRRSL